MPPVRILIVDDDAAFVEAVRAQLAGDGRFEVVGHADKGTDALQLARTLTPDLVLMDIAMPRMDGIVAARRLQKTCPGCRVVMLTGSDAVADFDRSREAGAIDYLRKDRLADLPESLSALAG